MDKDDKKEDGKDAGSGHVAELLFKSRNVLITGGIDDKVARTAVSHLLALAEDNDDPINLFISSPGGHVESGDMVHDMIKFIKPVVRTIGSGWVASAGALIFVGAAKENRYCLPNTRFLLHQPSGGVGGMASDIEIQAHQIQKMRERFEQLFADATGQTPEKIHEDTNRDFWLNTDEAIKYGLLGQVINAQSDLPKK
ncbi:MULTISPECIES: ATP-dependent Clp protease proteolytic subunit [unclassified Lentilitoribacter]|uniref:ATP-dependent Clp protease proteolytic subunit n=1 Tax=unclassified Lentilitoribacter TaxID=2647570 RepID=UPI0013A6D2C0|nr:ATP-dependent Clp protease proteolytic subunit [Lentilitoribacter sp. Alg239-R112]